MNKEQGTRNQEHPNSPKRIWVINPFDQLPNETDVPLRYWSLCRTFAAQGHDVIWWSSDFSHLTKSKRSPCPDTDGFSVCLIETPPYTKNISFARLKNHKAFAEGFYRDAMAGLKSGKLKAPDRIVVSLPPLGVAEAAFRIRDYVSQRAEDRGQRAENSELGTRNQELGTKNQEPGTRNQEPGTKNQEPGTRNQEPRTPPCQVIVDIMDAWPETFYQALPKPLRTTLGPLLLAPLHRSAQRAYEGADKISAVGQSYLALAQKYLGRAGASCSAQITEDRGQELGTWKQEPKNKNSMHLCYHGTDLNRFQRPRSGNAAKSEGQKVEEPPKSKTVSNQEQGTRNQEQGTRNQEQGTRNQEQRRQPLKTVYLGAMGTGYDLQTIIDVAARWKNEGEFPFQIHFAGDGPQLEQLKAISEQRGLSKNRNQQPRTRNKEQGTKNKERGTASEARIIFHGQLDREAVNELLLSADLALVPNRPGSLVACPYKAGEYAAAGLPMLSCLGGELGDLLKQWDAGSAYNEGDVESLHTAFKKASTNPKLLNQQGLNARKLAEALFDRSQTYQKLSEFILSNQ